MIKLFNPALYNGCNYLPMLLIYVNKRATVGSGSLMFTLQRNVLVYQNDEQTNTECNGQMRILSIFCSYVYSM